MRPMDFMLCVPLDNNQDIQQWIYIYHVSVFQTKKLLNKDVLANTNTAYTWMMSVEVHSMIKIWRQKFVRLNTNFISYIFDYAI